MAKPADRRIGKGYKVVSNQLDSIFGGLQSTGAGTAQALTASQARDLAAISRIAGRGSKAARTSVDATQAQAVNRYGSVMGGAAATALAPARAAAKATAVSARAGEGAAKMNAKAGQLAMDIQQQAAAEAQSAAQYAAAVALSERTRARQAEVEASGGGTGSQNFETAAGQLLSAASTVDYDGAVSLVGALSSMYNLGPKARGKLMDQVASLYPTGSGFSTINAQEAEGGPVNEFGEPYKWEGSRYQDSAKREVATVVNAAIRGDKDPTTGEAWTLTGLKEQVLSLFQDAEGGVTVPDVIIQAALAYAEHVWQNNIGAINKAGQDTSTEVGLSNTPVGLSSVSQRIAASPFSRRG